MAAHPCLDTPAPVAFAHRGGGLEAPENTLAAFAHAAALGYRHIETDVHATRDGVLLVFHDDTLERLTGLPGRPAEHDWAGLRSARILGAGEGIPLFDALLESFPGVRFNIDPKTDAAADALADALERHAAFDRVCVGSFSGARLARLRRRFGPRLCTSAGPAEVARAWLSGRGLPVGPTAPHCYQIPVRQYGVELVTPAFLRAARSRGQPVHVWTIDDPAEMERLLDLGVDGIMTDRPTLLKQVMQRRGVWRDQSSPGA
ncbi:glycerophosphoryl diester phosphodiesterase, putative [Rhodospirillum centenum SW]|uniref:Glycerophosphoryl diester phosphodiesterase, putative n=1 Tax=Rhodospirillum centenum (strain ATCC 51521 / SW) TaxID=414684 RepID=B6IVD2_RHOCS|nr:glycerophosphoryl diester phosphodiesterase, putative [Rhodospirillum centenum SW]